MALSEALYLLHFIYLLALYLFFHLFPYHFLLINFNIFFQINNLEINNGVG
jgi:hypothetical protein